MYSSLLARDEGDAQLLVNHKGKDTHHGGTALVELDGTLLQLGLFVEAVPAEVNGVIAEVTHEFSSSDVLHDTELEEANESNYLSNSGARDGVESGESIGDVFELEARVVDVSRETDSGFRDKVSNNGKHRDTAVLDLDVSEAVKLLLVTISDKAKGIEEAKRRLGTEFVLEGHIGGNRGTGRLLGRGKGGGTSEERGKNSELHLDSYTSIEIVMKDEEDK